MAIFDSFRSDPFVAHQRRLARAREDNPDRLTAGELVRAMSIALLATAVALALAVAWLGIFRYASPLASIMAVPLP
jgi:hypothetical protein